jgi:hypothetical protein
MKQQYTYQIGFNYGYVLAKYKQALIVKLAPFLMKKHDFLIGISDGKEEYEMEIQKDRLDDIDMLRSHSNRDMGRDL